MNGKVRALREVLAEESVGVLVRAALPWRARVTEEHLDASRDCELVMRLISWPRSNVTLRFSESGRVPMAVIIASRISTGPRRPGRCNSDTNRVERSTKVPIAEPLSLPMIRSPSQGPGTAR